MKLNHILKNMPHHTPSSPLPADIRGVTCRSGDVEPGFLFFAIDGNKRNGLDFVPEAAKRGAVAVVSESHDAGTLPNVRVSNVRSALAEASAAFYEHPSRRFYLAGVTGTNGKTTLTHLLGAVWSQAKTGRIGTIDISYPGFHEKARLTTPESLDLQKTFSQMAAAGTTHVAIEASSHALEQFRTFASDFDCAVFTNLTQDHLDYHASEDAYYQAKAKLFTRDLAGSSKKHKAAVINLDCPFGQRLANELKSSGLTLLTHSADKPDANIKLKNATLALSGTTFEITAFGKTFSGTTNLLGTYNLQNIMATLLVAQHSGIVIENAIEKLCRVAVPGRLERIANQNIFVDYAHTPDGLKNVLQTLRAVKPDRAKLIVVFGCGGDRDTGKRPLMGKIAAHTADSVIITSDNPRSENPDAIIKQILAGIPSEQLARVSVEVDRKTAIAFALKNRNPDDIVLIAGKGHEDGQIIGNTVLPFHDKTVVESLL